MLKFTEEDVLSYFREYRKVHGKSPTHAEIGEKFHIAKGTVKALIDRLVLEGKIKVKTSSKKRQLGRMIIPGKGTKPDPDRFQNPFLADPELKHEIKVMVEEYYPTKKNIAVLSQKDALSRTADMDGTPRSTDIKDPTARLAAYRADRIGPLLERIQAIDEAILAVDSMYRTPVWIYCTNKYASGVSVTMNYPISQRTLNRYQTRFYYEVAKRLNMV